MTTMFMLRVLELLFVVTAANLLVGLFFGFDPWNHIGVTIIVMTMWRLTLIPS